MKWHLATDTELLTVIFHEPNIPLSWIIEATEEYQRRHPWQRMKWYRYKGRTDTSRSVLDEDKRDKHDPGVVMGE